MRDGQAETYRAAWILAAGAPVAAGRNVRDRSHALLDGARGLDADDAGIGDIPGAVRSAARAGVPAVVAAGLAARGLGDVGGARRSDGDTGGGTARPARDSRLGGRPQPPGLDGVVVAPREGLKPTGAGPAARQGGVKPSLPCRVCPPVGGSAGRTYINPLATGRLRSRVTG